MYKNLKKIRLHFANSQTIDFALLFFFVSFFLISFFSPLSFYMAKMGRLKTFEKELLTMKNSMHFVEDKGEEERLDSLTKHPLLLNERNFFEKLSREEALYLYPPFQKRIDFLKGNALSWKEVAEEKGKGWKERIYQLEFPVEVEGKDIAAILAVIEGKHPLSPIYFFNQFHLSEKKGVGREKTFSLTCCVVQRGLDEA